MSSGDYAAISPLAQLFDELILGVDDECGIESGKAMPLHDEPRKKDASGVCAANGPAISGAENKHIQTIVTQVRSPPRLGCVSLFRIKRRQTNRLSLLLPHHGTQVPLLSPRQIWCFCHFFASISRLRRFCWLFLVGPLVRL
jgi:hypothetical protein